MTDYTPLSIYYIGFFVLNKEKCAGAQNWSLQHGVASLSRKVSSKNECSRTLLMYLEKQGIFLKVLSLKTVDNVSLKKYKSTNI